MKIFQWIIIVSFFLFYSVNVYAQCLENIPCSQPSSPKKEDPIMYSSEKQSEIAKQSIHLCDWGMCIGKTKQGVEDLAQNIIRFLARTVSSLAILVFMAGAILMMIRIDDDGRTQGKKMMLHSIIAIVIVFSAYVIVSFVLQVSYSLGK